MSTVRSKPKAQKSELSPNAFVGWKKAPTETEVAAAIGADKTLWDQLIAALNDKEFGVHDREWNSYSSKAGWSLKLKRGKRTILYLGPLNKSFRVAYVLGKENGISRQSQRSPSPDQTAHRQVAGLCGRHGSALRSALAKRYCDRPEAGEIQAGELNPRRG